MENSGPKIIKLKPIKPGQVYAWYPIKPNVWNMDSGKQYYEIMQKKGTHWITRYLFSDTDRKIFPNGRSVSTLEPKEIANGYYTLVHEDAQQFIKMWKILYEI